MAETASQQLEGYWRRKLPLDIDAAVRGGGDTRRDLYGAWDRFAVMAFVTLPNQLDRARDYRNRFLRAVL